jgi:murein DD-endopeptidase MepM/ murein hydrolase activator NlpD
VFAFAAPANAAYPDFPGEARRAVEFTVPLDGPIYEHFGYARGRLHGGIDIAVLRTANVRATLPGVVTAVGYLRSYSGYGNVVKIRHRNGFASMYAHLSSMRVRMGEWVAGEELIGRAGCTGSCTGPHLHFELRLRGARVNPLDFLPRISR